MNKLIKNWTYLLVSDVSQSVISFFVFMFLARKLSPEGYGVLNTILALASLFSVFSLNFSANQVIIREVTLHSGSTKNIFRIVLPIRIISLLLTIIALIIYQYYSGDGKVSFLIATSIIIISILIWDLAESIAFGHFVTKYTTIISISASLVWLLVVILLPSKSININMVVILYACVLLIRSFVYMNFSFHKFVTHKNEPNNLKWKAIVLMSMPYLWMRLVGSLGEQVPILLLKGYSGAAEVGFFAVGNRFIMPITLAVTTGLRAVFPFMTKLFQEDKEKFKLKLIEGFTFILILGSTIAMVLTISSGLWLPLFFGNAYLNSILAFNYQAWFGVLLCFDLLLSTVLSSTYRQKILATITTIDVLIVFPLMYFGAKHGAEGMAMAKLIGQIITVSYHIMVVILVLKTRINSLSFVLACTYFISFMVVSVFVVNLIAKIVIIVFILILYSSFKLSPLRQLVTLISSHIKIKI
jgi:O-antigen/teichoic acid export membrane protein